MHPSCAQKSLSEAETLHDPPHSQRIIGPSTKRLGVMGRERTKKRDSLKKQAAKAKLRKASLEMRLLDAKEELAAIATGIDRLAEAVEEVKVEFSRRRLADMRRFAATARKRGVRSGIGLIVRRRHKLSVPTASWRVIENLRVVDGKRTVLTRDIPMFTATGYRIETLLEHAHGSEYQAVREAEVALQKIRAELKPLVVRGTRLKQSIFQIERQLERMDQNPAVSPARKAKPALDQLSLPLGSFVPDSSIPQLRNPAG
jgi:hypothetical protein